jgi:integrase/recombinase XerC/integrase/recombinase XerD
MKVNDYFGLFLINKETTCSIKTVQNYKDNISKFIDFVKSDYGFEELDQVITKPNFELYVRHLRKKTKFENHPFKIVTDDLLTNTTIRSYTRDIKIFFRWLYDEEYLTVNIADKLKLIKNESKNLLPLCEKEVEKLKSLFCEKNETGVRNLCIISLMLETGLRAGEVVNLKINNIEFEKNLVIIEKGKGNKSRMVPLPNKLKKYLYKYLVVFRRILQEQTGYKKDYKNSPLFLNIGDEVPMTSNAIKQLFAKLKKRADIPRIKPHLLRHTFATSYILGGGDLESLRYYLGHADLKITQKYLHIANEQGIINNDIYKLDSIFFKRYY